MSVIAKKVVDAVRKVFKYNTVLEEWHVNHKGQRLFFDVFIKDLGVLIEIQGRQHFEFVKHFHGSREGFLEQKKRDNLKIALVEENKRLCLARFNYDEDITEELVLKRIHEALDSEVGYV